jgi:hypothetical protein
LQTGGGGKTGFPDASIAADQKDAPEFSLPPGSGG